MGLFRKSKDDRLIAYASKVTATLVNLSLNPGEILRAGPAMSMTMAGRGGNGDWFVTSHRIVIQAQGTGTHHYEGRDIASVDDTVSPSEGNGRLVVTMKDGTVLTGAFYGASVGPTNDGAAVARYVGSLGIAANILDSRTD